MKPGKALRKKEQKTSFTTQTIQIMILPMTKYPSKEQEPDEEQSEDKQSEPQELNVEEIATTR